MCARHIATSESSNNAFIRLIGIILCFGAVAAVTVLLLYLAKLGLTFTSGPLLIFVLVDAGLVAFAFFLFASDKVNHNNIMRFVSFALAGLMLFLNLFIISYLEATDDFLGSQFGMNTSGGQIEYSIVAQRQSNVELSTKNRIVAGIQSSDPFAKEVEKETKKLTSATFEEFENLSEMIGATEEDYVDVAIVQSVLLDAFSEYFPDAYDNLDVLATFSAGSATKTTTSDVKVDISKPFSVFVSGLDAEGDINNPGRSDANILILIDPEKYTMMLISTPRDYYVQLYGTSGYPDKLSHSGIYGLDMTERTIGELYDIDIDYHVLINFTTITTFVESMGGIVVNNPREFDLWGQTYGEGRIYLNGDQALLFARARGFADGDFVRIQNQQLVIEGIVDRFTSTEVIVSYKKVISNLSGTFISNVPPNVITQLFNRQISLGGDWTIEKLYAKGTPADRPTYSMGSQPLSVVIPDQNSVNEIRTAIKDFMRGN